MKAPYTYFETQPEEAHLEDEIYDECSKALGRPCLDVACIMNGKLVLVSRSVEPAKGLWLVGGRIRWHAFVNPFQYAALTAKEHFNIDVEKNTMKLLEPRFVCFSRRPYPEVLIWVMIKITQDEFNKIHLLTEEQKELHVFDSKVDLTNCLHKQGADGAHLQAITDLWDELERLGLVS